MKVTHIPLIHEYFKSRILCSSIYYIEKEQPCILFLPNFYTSPFIKANIKEHLAHFKEMEREKLVNFKNGFDYHIKRKSLQKILPIFNNKLIEYFLFKKIYTNSVAEISISAVFANILLTDFCIKQIQRPINGFDSLSSLEEHSLKNILLKDISLSDFEYATSVDCSGITFFKGSQQMEASL